MTKLTLLGLEKALEHSLGTHTVGDVVAQILAGNAQLWEDEDALIVTEVQVHPRKRVLHIWLATGDMDACIALHHRILRWAQEEQGCELATLAGRRGWERVLGSEGWTPRLSLMAKEIGEDG